MRTRSFINEECEGAAFSLMKNVCAAVCRCLFVQNLFRKFHVLVILSQALANRQTLLTVCASKCEADLSDYPEIVRKVITAWVYCHKQLFALSPPHH